MNPKAYILLSMILGSVLGTGFLSYRLNAATNDRLEQARADQMHRDAERIKSEGDTRDFKRIQIELDKKIIARLKLIENARK